jgi:nicotinate-nucleotide adenylyltransferase
MSGLPSAAAAAPRRIGLFGGSFNPPHVSHVLACHFALCQWPLDLVYAIPNFNHPFEKPLEPFHHRLAMTRLALRHITPFVEVLPIEQELGGVSYTVDTVRALRKRQPEVEFFLVIGSDIVEEASRWKEYEELRQLAPFLVIPRLHQGAGTVGEQFFLPEISSTQIREAIRSRREIEFGIPEDVAKYIREHGLYQQL